MDLFPPLLRVQLSTLFGDLTWLKKTASPKITLPSGAAHSQGWLTWQLQTKDMWTSEPLWGQLRPVLTPSLSAFFSSLRINPKSIAKNILYSGSCISFSIFSWIPREPNWQHLASGVRKQLPSWEFQTGSPAHRLALRTHLWWQQQHQ